MTLALQLVYVNLTFPALSENKSTKNVTCTVHIFVHRWLIKPHEVNAVYSLLENSLSKCSCNKSKTDFSIHYGASAIKQTLSETKANFVFYLSTIKAFRCFLFVLLMIQMFSLSYSSRNIAASVLHCKYTAVG